MALAPAVDVLFPPAGGRTADDPALARMALALEAALEDLVGVPVEATLRALPPTPVELVLDTCREDSGGLEALAAATPPGFVRRNRPLRDGGCRGRRQPARAASRVASSAPFALPSPRR
ncbi:MAG: hypothetical protein R3F43_04640 [bacterium]